MTELHLLASLDGERGNTIGVDPRNEFLDTPGDLHAVFIELALPQHAGEDGASKGLFGRDGPGGRTLMSARALVMLGLERFRRMMRLLSTNESGFGMTSGVSESPLPVGGVDLSDAASR